MRVMDLGGSMEILRNSIIISGIASEKDLPRQINGQLLEFSETDYIYMPENRLDINNISKIEVKLDTKEGRVINAPTGRIIVLDGVRKINITYTAVGYYQSYYNANIELPFNTFIDLPNNAGEVKLMKAYIIDAYFKLINCRKIYNHMLYMIDVDYQTIGTRSSTDTTINIKTLYPGDYEEENVVYTDE